MIKYLISRLSTVEHWDHLKEIKKNGKESTGELPILMHARLILTKRNRKKIENSSLNINYFM